MFCAHCGTQCLPEHKFCKGCGAAIGAPGATLDAPPLSAVPQIAAVPLAPVAVAPPPPPPPPPPPVFAAPMAPTALAVSASASARYDARHVSGLPGRPAAGLLRPRGGASALRPVEFS